MRYVVILDDELLEQLDGLPSQLERAASVVRRRARLAPIEDEARPSSALPAALNAEREVG